MNVKAIRSDGVYEKIMNAPFEKKNDIYRYEMMMPFEKKWACYNVPMKASTPNGYDVLMASILVQKVHPRNKRPRLNLTYKTMPNHLPRNTDLRQAVILEKRAKIVVLLLQPLQRIHLSLFISKSAKVDRQFPSITRKAQ